MTNYNDGNWHGWNGGECPVHPNSKVECVYMPEGAASPWEFANAAIAKNWRFPCLFRVVKEHREPREFWVCVGDGTQPAYGALEAAKIYRDRSRNVSIIHVREVIE